MGAVMKIVNPKVAGLAEGGRVAAAVKKLPRGLSARGPQRRRRWTAARRSRTGAPLCRLRGRAHAAYHDGLSGPVRKVPAVRRSRRRRRSRRSSALGAIVMVGSGNAGCRCRRCCRHRRRRRRRRRPRLPSSSPLSLVVAAVVLAGVGASGMLTRLKGGASLPSRAPVIASFQIGPGTSPPKTLLVRTPPMVMLLHLDASGPGRRPRPRRTCSACSRRTRRSSGRPSYRSCPRCRGR